MANSRILVVDDDPALLQTISIVLREQGYDVTTAEDGTRMLEALEQREPDLLLLDVLMPHLDGFQLLERLKSDERYADLPVLMVSSLPAEEATVRTLGLGAADYIRKPFRVRELLARIQSQLRNRAELRQAREQVRKGAADLVRAREEAETRRTMVDILHEVTDELSPEEIYHVVARRVARALNTSHCSVVLAKSGDKVGIVATAFEDPSVINYRIQLELYPEIRSALETQSPVLVEDVHASPLYAEIRERWAKQGTVVHIRSVIALPFSLDSAQVGVFFLRRTGEEPPFDKEDVEFANTVIKAAVSAIQRARMIETTKADNARLEVLARTDPLTQLLNRRVLVERLSQEVERARRYDGKITLLMIDLDHFKRVNDQYGHLVGDDVLRDVATLLKNALRAVDVVARYGGEEFVVVLPETPAPGALAFAERLRERIEATDFSAHPHGTFHLTTSIGMATFPGPRTESGEDLLARADEALYRAKADGRNRVRT
ncbi:MAG: diguanylate cyclase [Gemmatimonadetes bacterium]|nr:diguanylate cyclase [Gemmatimonadota bacterium]